MARQVRGYILRPGVPPAPLSFTEEELQALVVGAQWVSRQTVDALTLAAQIALAKIGSVLPPEMRRALDDDALYVGRKKGDASGLDLARIRQATRKQRKMHIMYTDQGGTVSERTIWPIMLGSVESRRFIAGWCELREDFRLFRADHIVNVDFLGDHYSRNRRQLVKEWQVQEELRRKRQDGS